MARTPAERDVGLFRPRLCGAAPFEGAIDNRVHLVEPPACAGCAASAHVSPTRSAVVFQSKFHLCFHAHKRSGRGQTNTGRWSKKIQTSKSRIQRSSNPGSNIQTRALKLYVWCLSEAWILEPAVRCSDITAVVAIIDANIINVESALMSGVSPRFTDE
jgi:hypothetical protein